MKVRPLLLLLLFVASAGILVWISFAAMRERTVPRSAAWEETLADLDTCCREKHIRSARYDHFADVAEQEQRHDAARLLRAMAFSGRLHEYNCAKAIVRLGGSYTPPAKATVIRGTTDSNLWRCIAREHRSPGTRQAEAIERAFAQGNRYAARVLVWARAGDIRQIAMMERYLAKATAAEGIPAGAATATGAENEAAEGTPGIPTDGYLVCPVCGNLYAAEHYDPFCPQCLTDSRVFVRFGQVGQPPGKGNRLGGYWPQRPAGYSGHRRDSLRPKGGQ